MVVAAVGACVESRSDFRNVQEHPAPNTEKRIARSAYPFAINQIGMRQLSDLLPTDLIEGVVEEALDVEAIEDDFGVTSTESSTSFATASPTDLSKA